MERTTDPRRPDPTRGDVSEHGSIETAVFDGRALANAMRDEFAEEIRKLEAAGHRAPCLCVVQVGDDPASRSYIKGKQRA